MADKHFSQWLFRVLPILVFATLVYRASTTTADTSRMWGLEELNAIATRPAEPLGVVDSDLQALSAWPQCDWTAGAGVEEQAQKKSYSIASFLAQRFPDESERVSIEDLTRTALIERKLLDGGGAGNLVLALAHSHAYVYRGAQALIYADAETDGERQTVVQLLDSLERKWYEILGDFLLSEKLIDFAQAGEIRAGTPFQVWAKLSQIPLPDESGELVITSLPNWRFVTAMSPAPDHSRNLRQIVGWVYSLSIQNEWLRVGEKLRRGGRILSKDGGLDGFRQTLQAAGIAENEYALINAVTEGQGVETMCTSFLPRAISLFRGRQQP